MAFLTRYASRLESPLLVPLSSTAPLGSRAIPQPTFPSPPTLPPPVLAHFLHSVCHGFIHLFTVTSICPPTRILSKLSEDKGPCSVHK